jgi:hypothetical protein
VGDFCGPKEQSSRFPFFLFSLCQNPARLAGVKIGQGNLFA